MRALFIGTLLAGHALLAAATTTTAVTTPAATPTVTKSAATSATSTISGAAIVRITVASVPPTNQPIASVASPGPAATHMAIRRSGAKGRRVPKLRDLTGWAEGNCMGLIM